MLSCACLVYSLSKFPQNTKRQQCLSSNKMTKVSSHILQNEIDIGSPSLLVHLKIYQGTCAKPFRSPVLKDQAAKSDITTDPINTVSVSDVLQYL